MEPTADRRGGSADPDSRLAVLAALAEPVRRALYRFVIARVEPVSRDQAADGVGVAHHVAKFHLDRLEAEGLLDVEYRRPPGRGGPGAGRPAKLYRRSGRQIQVSIPERRYELAGRLLAQAVTDATGGLPLADALDRAATCAGEALGATVRERAGRRPSAAAQREVVLEVLAEDGYEPYQDGEQVVLRNCPFDALVKDHTELMCGLNLAYLRGALKEADVRRLEACLEPAPGRCCVRLRPPATDTRAATSTGPDRLVHRRSTGANL